MAKILAIDFGAKRTGLAITDELQIIASGLTTVPTKEIFKYLIELNKKEDIECIVIGLPKRLDNTPTHATEKSNEFAEKIRKLFPKIKIERVDERYTSKMAFQTMIDSGLKKKDRRNKALVDEISATIILQSYMETINR